MNDAPSPEKARVVIAGGGIAGLEALLALNDLAGDRVAVTLVAPDPDFTYKPLMVEEPFSPQPAERRALAPVAAELGAGFVERGVTGVDPERHTVALSDGSELAYDVAHGLHRGTAPAGLSGRDHLPRARRVARHAGRAARGRRGGAAAAGLRRPARGRVAAAALRAGADGAPPGGGAGHWPTWSA